MAEPRLNAATEAVLRSFNGVTQDKAREIAAEVLYAVAKVDDPPKPKWPTDESLKCVYGQRPVGGFDASDSAAVSRALLADPIIQAAIPLVKSWETNYYRDSMTADAKALRRAVKEAGLLDD